MDFEHLLSLAGLCLSGEEKEELRENLEQMSGYVQMLKKVPNPATEEDTFPKDTIGKDVQKPQEDSRKVLREDICQASMKREELLANGPEVAGEFFVVPRSIG